MAVLITPEAVARYLGLPTVADEAVLQEVCDVAEARVLARCVPFPAAPSEPPVMLVPEEVVHAVLMQAARFYKRRLSPEGVAGFGDMGLVRVSSLDPDIEQLIERYLTVGFA